jgi:hypothetical protein
LLAGSLFSSEVETTRNDAGRGLLLFGDGVGSFQVIDPMESGLDLMGDVKDLKFIKLASGKTGVLVANNQGPLQLLEINPKSKFLLSSL